MNQEQSSRQMFLARLEQLRINQDSAVMHISDVVALLNDCDFLASKESETPALAVQVGGDHYKKLKIQPVEYVHANNIGYFEGNVIKYVTRWKDKNGIADLEKARHYLDLLIELEKKNAAAPIVQQP